MKRFLKVLGIIFLVVIVIGIIGAIFSGDESTETPTEQATTPTANSAPKDQSKWKYKEYTDEMDGSKTELAKLVSDNELEFEFPYNGGSSFSFYVRKKNGRHDLYLTVDKGQFLSSLLDDKQLRVKFDDGEAFKCRYSDASDGRADIIFPAYSDEFLQTLKKSKTMLIEAPFAFAGRQVIRFKTEGLKADF